MGESNWAGQQGQRYPNNSAADFKAGGMSDSQAAEARAAAERQRLAQQNKS